MANCIRQVHMIHDLLNSLKQFSMQLTESLQEHFFPQNLNTISNHKHNSRGVD